MNVSVSVPPTFLVAPPTLHRCAASVSASVSTQLSRPRRRLTVCCEKSVQSRAKQPLFEMRNVEFVSPRQLHISIFNGMNFHIDPGEFVMLIGPNGSGKSSVIKLMLGLESAVGFGKAKFLWKGEHIKPSRMFQHVGVVFQNPANFFVTRRVLDELRALRPGVTPDDVRNVLARVGLHDVSLLANPRSLSGGQVRRLAVADQLLKDPTPQLFVLDEPLAGVDWTARRDIINFLEQLKTSENMAILLVSHEPGEFLQFADRVLEVRDKRLETLDQCIVQKAIIVRRKLMEEKKRRAYEEARLYHLQMERERRSGTE